MSQFTNNPIDYSRFKQIISEFFGNRFHSTDVENIWRYVSGGKEKLDVNQFKRLHGDLWAASSDAIISEFPKDSWKYQDFSIIKGTTVRSNDHEYEEK
jgi:hypothetical protein